MNKYKPLLKQGVLFGLVGLGSLLIDLAVTASLYNFLHTPAAAAGIAGFLAAFAFNFPINRKHVFLNDSTARFKIKLQVILYFSLCTINIFITGLFMEWLVGGGFVSIVVGKILTTGIISIYNFFILKFFIFSKIHSKSIDNIH